MEMLKTMAEATALIHAGLIHVACHAKSSHQDHKACI